MAEEVDVIPEWKIKHAWAQCMKDARLSAYFSNAPYGAKQYVALAFYCKVFADEVNEAKYRVYVSEVEAQMDAEDMKYVALRDDDNGARRYFAARLAEKFPEAVAGLIAEQQAEARAAAESVAPSATVQGAAAPVAAKRPFRIPTWVFAALSLALLAALVWAMVVRRPAPVVDLSVGVGTEESVPPQRVAPAADAEADRNAASAEARSEAAMALIRLKQELEDQRRALTEERKRLEEEKLELKMEREAFEAERKSTAVK